MHDSKLVGAVQKHVGMIAQSSTNHPLSNINHKRTTQNWNRKSIQNIISLASHAIVVWFADHYAIMVGFADQYAIMVGARHSSLHHCRIRWPICNPGRIKSFIITSWSDSLTNMQSWSDRPTSYSWRQSPTMHICSLHCHDKCAHRIDRLAQAWLLLCSTKVRAGAMVLKQHAKLSQLLPWSAPSSQKKVAR